MTKRQRAYWTQRNTESQLEVEAEIESTNTEGKEKVQDDKATSGLLEEQRTRKTQ